MQKGLLWFDDSERDLAEKIGRAARRYRQKYGAEPDVCYVHPSTLNGNGARRKIGEVRIAPLPHVLRHHFWVVQDEEQRTTRRSVVDHAQATPEPARQLPMELEVEGRR